MNPFDVNEGNIYQIKEVWTTPNNPESPIPLMGYSSIVKVITLASNCLESISKMHDGDNEKIIVIARQCYLKKYEYKIIGTNMAFTLGKFVEYFDKFDHSLEKIMYKHLRERGLETIEVIHTDPRVKPMINEKRWKERGIIV